MIYALLSVFASSEEYTSTIQSFAVWRSRHGGHDIGTVEARFAAWKENLGLVQEHNKRADAGEHSFRLGMTHLADLTNDEYRQLLLRPRQDKDRSRSSRS